MHILLQCIYYSDIKTEFTRICPDLKFGGESTLTKQRKSLKPPGLTIVARITGQEELPFMEAVQKVRTESGKKFYANKFLHLTLLGLFNHKRKHSHSHANDIINSSKEFIEQKHYACMTFKFNLIRLGAFYRYGRSCDGNSDGTLVAMADTKSPEVNKFNILGDDLACHLRINFPSIFYPDIHLRLKREHQTVWSTLGYFNQTDFDIDEKLVPILEELKSFNAVVNVSQLEFRSYENRSLEKSNLIDVIKV